MLRSFIAALDETVSSRPILPPEKLALFRPFFGRGE